MRSFFLYLILFLASFVVGAAIALGVGALARAETTDPRIDKVASVIAHQPITAGCYAADEPGSPFLIDAWGYTYLGSTYIYLDGPDVCKGIRAILDHNPKVAPWRQAIGALTLAHESYHLNPYVRYPGSEALTECRAIRATAGTIRLLGGSEKLVDRLMPYALADHFRVGALYPQYNYRACRVPWYW